MRNAVASSIEMCTETLELGKKAKQAQINDHARTGDCAGQSSRLEQLRRKQKRSRVPATPLKLRSDQSFKIRDCEENSALLRVRTTTHPVGNLGF